MTLTFVEDQNVSRKQNLLASFLHTFRVKRMTFEMMLKLLKFLSNILVQPNVRFLNYRKITLVCIRMSTNIFGSNLV